MVLVGEERVVRTGTTAVVVAIALSMLLAPFGEPWRTGVAGVVAVVLIALGSPHGALDHLVLLTGRPRTAERSTGDAPGGRQPVVRGMRRLRGLSRQVMPGLSARFVAGYVSLAGLSLAGYLLAPRLGFALFLVLSVAHFAAGEAGVTVERELARGWRDPLAWAASLGGAVVVVLPLASREAGAALAAVDPRLAPVLSPLPALATVVTALVVVALIGCVLAALRGDDRARTVGLELAALGALSVLAHPLLAFATFFAFWHSLRHQARLAQVLRPDPPHVPARWAGRPLTEVLASARAGVPATVGVLLAAVALALTGATLLGGLLAVIWALTVPHSLAVALLEVRTVRARTSSRPRGTPGEPGASNRHGTTTPAAGADARPAPAGPDRVRG